MDEYYGSCYLRMKMNFIRRKMELKENRKQEKKMSIVTIIKIFTNRDSTSV